MPGVSAVVLVPGMAVLPSPAVVAVLGVRTVFVAHAGFFPLVIPV
ncbi:hypothetical protein GCM10028793_22850 [Nocardiopsis oceani]